jgi:hypothetical protein
MIARTKTAISEGATVVYEAAFEHDGVFAAVDVLEADGSGGWRIVEVKSTCSVKPTHVLDVAVQLSVLENAGLLVSGADVMHLNPRHGLDVGGDGTIDPSDGSGQADDLCLERMTYRELQVLCKAAGIRANQKAVVLRSALREQAKRNDGTIRCEDPCGAAASADVAPLFLRQDVFEEARRLAKTVPSLVADCRTVLDREEEPVASVGSRCLKPYPCEFYARCHPGPTDKEAAGGPIATLYRPSPRLRDELERRGVARIADIPQDICLSGIADRQKRAWAAVAQTAVAQTAVAAPVDAGTAGPASAGASATATGAAATAACARDKRVVDARERETVAADSRAADTSVVVVDNPDILAAALSEIREPVVFLDFEAINPALPPWPLVRPYGQVPVQVSMHRRDADGVVTHTDWLADGVEDPRPALARAVLEGVRGARSLVAYAAGFERRALADLAQFLPEHTGERTELLAARERFVDLLPIVRAHVYARDFQGSFSLKKVLPALVPDLSYDDLEVQGGHTAAIELERFILGRGQDAGRSEGRAVGSQEPGDLDRGNMRRALLAYCERDTLALVELADALNKLADSQLRAAKSSQTR